MIAWQQLVDPLNDPLTFHNACCFVAQHTREEPFGDLANDGALAGVAQRSGHDLDTEQE
jgi:hypothetical protein